MAVYFEPQRRSWIDYAAPVLSEILGGVIKGNNDVKAKKLDYDLRQQEADAAQSRQWGDRANKLMMLGAQPDENGNVVAQALESLRNNPEQAFKSIAQMKSIVPEINETGMLNNLNPAMSFQAIDQGNKITAGGFDPLKGVYNGQTYDVGVHPTQKLVSDNALAGTKYNTDGSIKVAGIHEAGATSRARMQEAGANHRAGMQATREKAADIMFDAAGNIIFVDRYGRKITNSGVAGQPPVQKGSYGTVPLENDEVGVLNKNTGKIEKSGLKGAPKANKNNDLLELLYGGNTPTASAAPPAQKEGWSLQNVFGGFGGGEAQASQAPPVPPDLYGQMKNAGYTDEEITAWARKQK